MLKKELLESKSKIFLVTISIIAIYYLVDILQIFLLTELNISSSKNLFASYVYLPNGLRVLFVFVFGVLTFPGLLIAHLISGYLNYNEFNFLVIFSSLFSTLSPFMGLFIVYKKFNLSFYEIKITKIVYVAIYTSLLNSFFSVLTRFVFDFYNTKNIFSFQFLKFLVGDILGVLFIFLFIVIFIKIFDKKNNIYK
tara:strand:- start:328 stop:912 length:585 start_codon:yes stop_codon:yes gene_type:complete